MSDDDEHTELATTYILKKRSKRARMGALCDNLKSVSEYSVALYRAMLANVGGFFEHRKNGAAAVEALAEACQKLEVDVEAKDDFEDLIDIVCEIHSYV